MTQASTRPHARHRWAVWLALAGHVGCADAAVDAAPTLTWRAVGEIGLDETAEGSPALVEIPSGARFVALRAVPLDVDPALADSLCYRLGPVIDLDSGLELVAPAEDQDRASRACTRCTEKVYAGPDRAFAVWPSGLAPLPVGARLSLGLDVRDCATGIRASRTRTPRAPTLARVDLAWEPEPTEPRRPVLSIRVAAFADAGVDLDSVAFAVMWRIAQERFARAGIALERELTTPLPIEAGVIAYGPADAEALDAIGDAVRAASGDAPETRHVPLALVSCLRHDDPLAGSTSYPLGLSTRIPDSLALGARTSLVAVATGRCDGQAPTGDDVERAERLGLVLAHELGHYLGLHHPASSSGLGPRGADERLMEPSVWELPGSRAWFSDGEAGVMRRHPDVTSR